MFIHGQPRGTADCSPCAPSTDAPIRRSKTPATAARAAIVRAGWKGCRSRNTWRQTDPKEASKHLPGIRRMAPGSLPGHDLVLQRLLIRYRPAEILTRQQRLSGAKEWRWKTSRSPMNENLDSPLRRRIASLWTREEAWQIPASPNNFRDVLKAPILPRTGLGGNDARNFGFAVAACEFR